MIVFSLLQPVQSTMLEELCGLPLRKGWLLQPHVKMQTPGSGEDYYIVWDRTCFKACTEKVVVTILCALKSSVAFVTVPMSNLHSLNPY